MKNASGKELMRACAKYILGESTGIKIKGTPERRAAIQEALVSSKALFEALSNNRPLSEVNPLIERKRAAAKEFKRIIGITWQL